MFRKRLWAIGLFLLSGCLALAWVIASPQARAVVETGNGTGDPTAAEAVADGGSGGTPTRSSQSGFETILLVGLDEGMRQAGSSPGKVEFADIDLPDVRGRNDVVLLIGLDHRNDTVRFLHIPRDTLVPLPDHGEQKLAHTMAYFPFDELRAVVGDILGLTVDHYAIVDFEGFNALVDAIGGVDVTVDHDLPSRSGGYLLTAGTHHLDGEMALEFVRHRYGEPQADISRLQFQKTFLVSLAGRLTRGALVPALTAFAEHPGIVKTDLTPGQVLGLYLRWKDYDPARIEDRCLPGWCEGPNWRLDPDLIEATTAWFKGWPLPGQGR